MIKSDAFSVYMSEVFFLPHGFEPKLTNILELLRIISYLAHFSRQKERRTENITKVGLS